MSNRISKEIDRAAKRVGIDPKEIDKLQDELREAAVEVAVPWFKRIFFSLFSKLGKR